MLKIAVMQPFGSRQRGSKSSTSAFVGELGMTVGIAIYGIFQRNLRHGEMVKSFAGLGQLPEGLNLQDSHTILFPVVRAHLPGAILAKVTAALSLSVVHTFAWALIPALLTLALVVLMGPEKMDLRRMCE